MESQIHKLSLSAQKIWELLNDTIARQLIDVPMLPEVANKALILAQNPESDAGEMARLIQSDQSLAGHVMRIANSAAYTPMSNLISLQQAIARLGMNVISEIALTAAIGAKMFHTPKYEAYVAGIWRHALATSLWAKEIARHCRSNVEVAFLSGLLHSIGRPAVLQTILDLAKQKQCELTAEDVHQIEESHCHQVTKMVINSWHMPHLVIEAVSYYNDYNNAEQAVDQAAQVNLAIHFASFMLNPETIDQTTLMSLPALTTLNLYQDEVEKLLMQTPQIQVRLEGLSS